jgi:hypothetical protein
MGLRGKLGAAARGEVSTSALEAYGTANNDAYDLLERVPAEGPERLSAWCAFVLQTHADNLVGSGSAPGYCDPEAFADATSLYQLAGAWLSRARAARTGTGNALDTVVPQPYLQSRGPQGGGQVRALRATLETVQSRLGADLASRSTEPIYQRLAPTLPALQSALDAGAGLSRSKAGPELLATIGSTLLVALDRAYQTGQLLAMPDLIASTPAPSPAPAEANSTTLTMFVPGDPGFDRWCLTDPLEHIRQRESAFAIAALDRFWASDPEPAKTLALQAQIAGAIEKGLADYLPEAVGRLAEIAKSCPWPGVLLVKAAFVVGDTQLGVADQFVLSVGSDGTGFRRTIAVISAHLLPELSEQDAQLIDDEHWAREHGFD